GRPVRGSRTGRPVMALLHLLSRRWALRAIWELRAGRLTFRALQGACGGGSPAVLNRPPRQVPERRPADLAGRPGPRPAPPGPAGRELIEVVLPLAEWSRRWARAIPPER